MEEGIDIIVRMGNLTGRYFKGELSDTEKQELKDWIAESETNRELFLNLLQSDAVKEYQPAVTQFDPSEKLISLTKEWEAKRRMGKIILYMRWAAITFFLTCSSYYLIKSYMNASHENQPVAHQMPVIAPGAQRAILVLGSGKQITLDKGTDTSLMKDKSLVAQQHGGILSYQNLNTTNPVETNVLLTPKGGEYHLVLSDGTGVWLNAGSSIRFPTAFVEADRKVEVSGEVYFDVAKSGNKPFIVSTNQLQVQVLGTAFNINAYAEDGNIFTTLLTGAVKIIKDNQSIVLKPGQQATTGSNAFHLTSVDLSPVIAWKDGLFIFDQADIPTVMNQLKRWYDINIEYSPDFKPDQHFSGKVSRYVPINQLLSMISQTGIAKFQITGRKITVLPGSEQ